MTKADWLPLVMVIVHLSIFIGYCTGIVYTNYTQPNAPQDAFVHSLWIPISHLLAALVLLIGLWFDSARWWASLFSAAVWAGYAAVLGASASQRGVPYTGTIMAAGFLLVSLVIVGTWGDRDEEDL